MTPVEKKKAFAERCFVELFGTAAYITLLHLGQDLAAKPLESWQKNLVKISRDEAVREVRNGNFKYDAETFAKFFDEVYGDETKGLIARIGYGEKKSNGQYVQALRRTLCEKLNVSPKRATEELPKALSGNFRAKANLISYLAILFGVLLSTFLGGYGIQWLNDHPFNVWLRKRYPETPPQGFLALPKTDAGQFGNYENFKANDNPFSRHELAFQSVNPAYNKRGMP